MAHIFFTPKSCYIAGRVFHPKVAWRRNETPHEQVGARSLASLIPVSSMKKMKRAEQLSDDTDQPPRQQQCVRIGTEEVPLDTEELYYNQLHWAY